MGAVQLIYIRADGNDDIASGHLMRCLTIAREIQKKGHYVCFLVSDTDSVAILSANEPDIVSVSLKKPFSDSGIAVLRLPDADYRDTEKELSTLLALLKAHPGTLLIDSYFVTEKYLEELRGITRTAYMDDLRAFDYPADLLVNYDCFTPAMAEEYRRQCSRAGQLLLGAEFAPLRPQFTGQHITVTDSVRNIILTTGAGDPYHFALRFCQRISGCTKDDPLTQYQYHIVVGSLNPDSDALNEVEARCSCIKLHKGLTDLMPLMLSSDLAITAGGTTLYELCALGVPTIAFAMSDNQVINPQILDEQRIVPYAGDIRTQMDLVLERCIQFIQEYASDFEKRKTAHTSMNSLIKGDGALQIADAVLSLSSHIK